MPVGIIILLEVVNIHQNQRQRLLIAHRRLKLLFQVVLERAMIVQSC
jgi:hypothetical protein